MPLTLRPVRARVASAVAVLLVVAAAASAGDTAPAAAASGTSGDTGDGTFTVSFNTRRPLGLKLSPSLAVVGFHRDRPHLRAPAEATGWVRQGDALVAVNGQPVEGLPLGDVSTLIARAAVPKVLHFRAGDGGDRAAEVAALGGGVNTGDGDAGGGGVIELFKQGAPLSPTTRFVKAAFGGQPHCSVARGVVLADPPSGCQAYRNARHAANSLVLVRRGGCTFTHKALLAQAAGAVAVVVINSDEGGGGGGGDEPVVMPGDPAAAAEVAIPAVMVSHAGGEALLGHLKQVQLHVRSDVTARTLRDGARCATATPSPTRDAGPAARSLAGSGGGADTGAHADLGGDGTGGAAGGELLVTVVTSTPQPAAATASPASTSGKGARRPAAVTPTIIRLAPQQQGSYDPGDDADDDGSGGARPRPRRTAGVSAVLSDHMGTPAPPPSTAAAGAAAAAAARSSVGEAAVMATGRVTLAAPLAAAEMTPEQALAQARHDTAARLEFLLARFGPQALPHQPLPVVLAQPTDGCGEQLLPAAPRGAAYEGAAVLVDRGGCPFATKWAAVAAAGGALMVVANNVAGLTRMSGGGSDGGVADDGAAGGRRASLPPAVMVTRAAGRELRRLLEQGAAGAPVADSNATAAAAAAATPSLLLRAVRLPAVEALWAELEALLPADGGATWWPADDLARRKAYTRLARTHHPDKPTGSLDRFDTLRYAYAVANHRHAPDRFPAPDAPAGYAADEAR